MPICCRYGTTTRMQCFLIIPRNHNVVYKDASVNLCASSGFKSGKKQAGYICCHSTLCMSRKEKIFFVLILFFFFTLFFARLQLLNTIATVAVVAYSLLFNSINQKWQLLKRRRYLQGMLLFFAWVVISLLLSQNLNKGLSFLDPRLALFYFPLC